MKGTFFSSDFVIDNNGNERLIEINTDTNMIPSVSNSSIIDYSELFTVLQTNNISELHVVYKPDLHTTMVNFLSQSLAISAPFITTFSETKVTSDNIFPASPEDSDSKFILRMAYDETAILDSEYAKGTLNLLTLFADNGDSGSVVNFYHSSSLYGSYNTLDYTINDSNIPDATIKTIFEQHKPIGFYKLGNSTDTNENRWNSFANTSTNVGNVIQQYHCDNNTIIDNKITSIRNFGIVYGPNLDFISVGEYTIPAILELPTTLEGEIDDTIISNKLNNKHYHEFTTNAPKPFTSGILGSTNILMANDTYKALQDLEQNDLIESYFIEGTPQNDNTIELLNWKSDGIPLPTGSYLTSSLVINKFLEDTEYNTINELVIDNTDSIYAGTKKMFLVYDSGSNATIYKFAADIDPASDYLYDVSASIFPITANNMFVLDDETFKLVEIDVETTDTYLISGSNHYNAIITHNIYCFVAGTEITLSDNSTKNIEDIKIGDEILSYNETTLVIEPKKVIGLKQPIHNDLVKYSLENGTSITCTFDHPFYVNDMELASFSPKLTNERYTLNTEVKQIKLDDGVYNNKMEKVLIKSIDVVDQINTQTYIFEVEDNNNFYANGILTHNKAFTCFVSGTSIKMFDGTEKNIEDVVKGDVVLSWEETTNEKVAGIVSETLVADANSVIEIKFENGTTIVTTEEHPFYVSENWVKAKDLTIDMVCTTSDDSTSKIETITIKKENTTVYNLLDVTDSHTFYANNILVHNK